MKPTIKLTAVFVLLLVTLSPQAVASADMYRNEGRTAWANFYSTDASGCVRTHVEIETGEDFIYSISIAKYDMCLGHSFFEAYGNKMLSKSDVRFIGNLDAVKLTTTVQVTDFEQALSFDVSIDLTWTGTGEIVLNKGHFNDVSTDCHVNAKWKSQYREAQASGTVSDGTTNFTPVLTHNAELYSWKQRRVSQGCE